MLDVRLAQCPKPIGEIRPEVVRKQLERHSILWAARPRHGWNDSREVELEDIVEFEAGAGQPPQALLLGIALDEVDPLVRPTGQPQVGEGLVVDREERGRSAELWA